MQHFRLNGIQRFILGTGGLLAMVYAFARYSDSESATLPFCVAMICIVSALSGPNNFKIGIPVFLMSSTFWKWIGALVALAILCFGYVVRNQQLVDAVRYKAEAAQYAAYAAQSAKEAALAASKEAEADRAQKAMLKAIQSSSQSVGPPNHQLPQDAPTSNTLLPLSDGYGAQVETEE